MRVFVAGASGVIGQPLIRRLAGHEVIGTTRSPERAKLVERAGGKPVICNAMIAEQVARAVLEARPEVLIHQLTALPDRFEPRKRDLYRGQAAAARSTLAGTGSRWPNGCRDVDRTAWSLERQGPPGPRLAAGLAELARASTARGARKGER